jgi:hypothetical protein
MTRYISNRHPSTLRYGTVATKHIAGTGNWTLCGRKLKEAFVVNDARQMHVCDKCKRAAGI